MSIPSSGSSTARRASTTSSFVGIRPRLPEQPHFLAAVSGEEVDAVHEANPVAARAHDERVRPGRIGEEADPAEQVTVRDAGRRDDHLTGGKVVDGEDLFMVIDRFLLLLFVLVLPR